MLKPSPPDLTRNRALYCDVESYVLALIRSGEAQPGDRVNEAEIARQLRISRTPVREAFARLIKDGILTYSPRRGVFVPQYSRQDMEEISSLRVVLEGFAARLACQRIQPEDMERLQRILQEGAAAGRSGEWLLIEEKNAEFHDALIRIAGHDLLLRVWGMLNPLLWKLTPAVHLESITEEAVLSFLQRHQALLDAILSGDADRAEQTSMTHVREGSRHTLGL